MVAADREEVERCNPVTIEHADIEWSGTLRSGWAVAKAALESVITKSGIRFDEVDIGWITFLGEGMFRSGYQAYLEGHPLWQGEVVILLPKLDAPTAIRANWDKEISVLAALGPRKLLFRVPKLLAVVRTSWGPIMIEEKAQGIPLDFRKGRQSWLDPIDFVAKTAVEIHKIDCVPVFSGSSGGTNRSTFARRHFEDFKGNADSQIQSALAWCEQHLPPAEPCCLVHGDLLGQNIIVDSEMPPSWTVIDWTAACLGDPAYDLAIVTRGKREPFQTTNGLQRLVARYLELGGESIEIEHVRFYEVCLAIGWLAATIKDSPLSGQVGEYRRLIERLTA